MANESYLVRGTPIVWSDSGADLVITLNNLATVTGRVGARKDWGASPQPAYFIWRFTCQFETAPVVGESIGIYLAWSDGTEEDGQVGTADAALSALNKVKNLHRIGSLIVDVATVDIDFTASGECVMPDRYSSPVIVNNTVDNLQATANTSTFTMTPVYWQTQ